MWHMDDWGYGMMGIGMLFNVLFWAVVIVGIVALVKWLFGASRHARERPLDVLKTRYAKGEVTREQYEQMKKDLR